MTFRRIIFWAHLVCGVTAGLCIGVMCFTGAALAFEKQLTAWGERDARRVDVPAPYPERLSLAVIQQRLREKFPEARPATMVIQNDPAAAVAFPAGRAAGYYVNPYTGEVRQPGSTTAAGFMATMIEWHRYLGFSGETSRPRGKLVNGACNLAFCVLAISGLYLWMPRRWTWTSVKAVAVLSGRLIGKARDFNWHNAIGLWSAPVLIVLTLTAIPISFQWGGRVINTFTGTPQTPPGAQPRIEIPAPSADAPLLSPDVLLAVVAKEIPDWITITLRPDAMGTAPAAGRAAGPIVRQATVFTVRYGSSWPRTATATVAVNPYTREIVRRTGHAELPAAQRVRAWTRFLHTGEALGWGGQLVAGLACAGGCVLVWTGLSLAWRRFFASRRRAS